MDSKIRRGFGLMGMLLWGGLSLGGCGSSDGLVLRVDAEFNPVVGANQQVGISEANRGVAQSCTVLSAGKLEKFSLIITDGPSPDDGVIRITVRPLNAMGEPDPDPASSIIVPIDLDTTTLPATLVETFTEFFVGNDPGRQVMPGEEYAIVVDFVSRTGVDTAAIALVLGQDNSGGDPYAGGTGWTGESLVGFTANTDDYIFRTFVLQ